MLLLNLAIRTKAAVPLPPADLDGLILWDAPIRLQTRGGRTWIETGDAPARRRRDPALIAGLRRGHQILAAAGIQAAVRHRSGAMQNPWRSLPPWLAAAGGSGG